MSNSNNNFQKHLAVLVFTDFAGYSTMAELNESLAKELIAEHRKLIRLLAYEFEGLEHDTAGDGFFLEFASAENAFNFAVKVQLSLRDRNRTEIPYRHIRIRIGIHLGEIQKLEDGVTGHNVNVAARVQTLAPVGGICITQAVYDQVFEKLGAIKLKKVGRQKLKNITQAPQLYSYTPEEQRLSTVKLPFHFKVPSFSRLMFLLTYFACITIFLSLSIRIEQGFSNGESVAPTTQRSPAAVENSLDLSHNWSISKEGFPPEPFNPEEPWKYIDRFAGKYKLDTQFEYDLDLQEPTLVLGLSPGKSRIFLNDYFIGGSDHLNDLNSFAIDKKILKPKNALSVFVDAPPSSNTGLTKLPEVGIRLGEFSEIRRSVIDDINRYQIWQSVSLICSAIVWIAISLVFLWSEAMVSQLYASLYLLMGVLYLSYYSPWVPEVANYQTLKFIKVLSLSLGGLALLGGFLSEKKYERGLKYLNIVSSLWLLWMIYDFFFVTHTGLDFISMNDVYLKAGFALSLIWPLAHLFQRAKVMLQNAFSGIPFEWNPRKILQFSTVYFLFSICNSFACLGAIKGSVEVHSLNMSLQTKSAIVSGTVMLPFAFAVIMTGLLIVRSYFNHNLFYRRKQRDRVLNEIFRHMKQTKDRPELVVNMQHLLCDCVDATRSSLFKSVNNGQGESFVLISRANLYDVNQPLPQSLPSNGEGILDYAFKFQTPLLIEDLNKDPRFQKASGTYRTNSCMIFPLTFAGKNIGILTFADKATGKSFTSEDFAIISELQASLAGLIYSIATDEAKTKTVA